jgi:DNA mismatch repair protein MSH3
LQEEKNERNTLFWILNHTKTPFGRRLLRKWTANPLRRVAEVERRQAAVSQLSSSESPSVSLLKKLVSRLPDLEKMLCSAYHKKVSKHIPLMEYISRHQWDRSIVHTLLWHLQH